MFAVDSTFENELKEFILNNLGNQWKQVSLHIGRRVAPFKIVLKARRSYNAFGDIAIDDLSFHFCSFPKPQSSCYSNQHRCMNRACVSSNRKCDMTDDCGDGSDELSCSGYTRRVAHCSVATAILIASTRTHCKYVLNFLSLLG